jgi:predicted DNA-binding transcriptional regulator AlpA
MVGDWRSREFLTVQEAADILRESVRTFYRKIAHGIYPPCRKDGKRSLVVVSWLIRQVDRLKGC